MKRALIDLRSILWTGLMAGKGENSRKVVFNGKEINVNDADHGYDNALDHILMVLEDLGIQPRDIILVDEGKNSKRMRLRMFEGYKAGREQPDDQTIEFNKAKEMLITALLNVGAQLAWQDGMEADDVIAYLARNLKGERWIVSNDGDLAALIAPEQGIHLWQRGARDQNPFGPFSPRFITVYKALVGDSSDKYGGAYKFGEGAWNKLLDLFGEEGLETLEGLIVGKRLLELGEDVGELKELQRVIDGAEGVYVSYALAKLYPEKVNTLRQPLSWRAGMVRNVCDETDDRLRGFSGQVRLIHAGNYAQAKAWAAEQIRKSPYVALDIETSTPPESDEWLAAQDKEDGSVVDVFGSELTGLGMTFGPNCQYTFYLTHDHVEEAGVTNLTREQVRDFVDMVPREKVTLVHNAQFELPVLYQEWGADWADDPEYHGFLRCVRDTRIMSSYVDENRRAGLKGLSSEILGYEQENYDHVTKVIYLPYNMPSTGKEVRRWEDEDGVEWVEVQHKMNELTAKHVLSYGADDCICTAALANHFRIIMEIENTYDVFEEVETFPAYLTALGFVQGVDFDAEAMRKMEKEDDETYEKSWAVLRDYLIELKWDGVVCPVFTDLEPASVKAAFEIVTGHPLDTRVRNRDKMARVIELWAEENDHSTAAVLAVAVNDGDLDTVNKLAAANFNGEPKLDLASPKQMKGLLYDHIGMPIHIINDVTDLEKQHNKPLFEAVRKFKRKRSGATDVTITDDDLKLLRAKAKTDETAIAFALAFSRDLISDRDVEALEAVKSMKKVMTRRSLFYKNYRYARHWKDGKIHSSMNQCAAVTRRYSSSGPNLQQLPKKGEGVKFRECLLPHHKNAVICSVDFKGQELRLAAERSQDKNMLACYVGDNLKDPHSITAAGAMKLKWGSQAVKELFAQYGSEGDDEYSLFLKVHAIGKSAPIGKKADDLRKDSKNVNFTAQFGGQAAKISERLIMPLEDAQLFLQARAEMFPDVEVAAKKAEQVCMNTGYATTLMGARRHLAKGILSNSSQEQQRAARQAWNMEIQGSAAEMTKLAMARLWKSGLLWKYDVRFIAPIHDELVTSIAAKDAVEVIKVKHECMTAPYSTMKVPVWGSISVGPDFAHQAECGDWYIKENIESALSDIFDEREALAA